MKICAVGVSSLIAITAWPVAAERPTKGLETPTERKPEAREVRFVCPEDLAWSPMDVPKGGRRTPLMTMGHELVVWPAGSEVSLQQRVGRWDGFLVSGSMQLMSSAGRWLAGPGSYFKVTGPGTFTAECVRTTPCMFFGFGTDDDGTQPLSSKARPSGTSPLIKVGGLRDGPQLELGAPTFARLGETFGVGMNLLRTHQFVEGPALPLPERAGQFTFGFVISGEMSFQAEQLQRTLGPGSFFWVPRGVAFSSRCLTEDCLLVALERHPEWY